MRRWRRTSARFGVCVVVGCLLLVSLPGAALAQDGAGWYGPYSDGCSYWWDGYQWTSDVDCDGDGYADSPEGGYPAGWYGPYDDGCNHWWDGYQWTIDVDCDGDGLADTLVVEYPAGWYGPYDDGCYYWWDGYEWSGDVDCDGDGYVDTPATSYPPDWYGPFANGCMYWWDGTRYSGEFDCDGDGVTDASEETYPPDWYDLYGDGCLYWFDGASYTGDVDCNGDGRTDVEQQPENINTTSVDEFIDTQVDAINRMWANRFAARGLTYSNTGVVVADGPVNIGCLTADGDQLLETEDWIFYCSADETIYFGPGNLDRVVLSGIGTVQFMEAHEVGHHVQSEIDPSFSTNYSADTVAYENQATCMAGVWFHELDAAGTPSDINEAMTYLSTATDAVHGKGEDQVAELLKGYHDPNAC